MAEELAHYGILRRSGRYPWGSGKDKYQRSVSIQGMVADLKKQGLSETEIANLSAPRNQVYGCKRA